MKIQQVGQKFLLTAVSAVVVSAIDLARPTMAATFTFSFTQGNWETLEGVPITGGSLSGAFSANVVADSAGDITVLYTKNAGGGNITDFSATFSEVLSDGTSLRREWSLSDLQQLAYTGSSDDSGLLSLFAYGGPFIPTGGYRFVSINFYGSETASYIGNVLVGGGPNGLDHFLPFATSEGDLLGRGAIPEPTTILGVAIAGAGLASIRRHRRGSGQKV